MKKAFTLSEALVTLAVIGILAAVLVPVMNKAKPDKDKMVYKKALYIMQTAMGSANNRLEELTPTGDWSEDDIRINHSDEFCNTIVSVLNTVGKTDCTSSSDADHPNFKTTDGIKFWGLEGAFPDPSVIGIKFSKTVYFDRVMDSSEETKYENYRKAKRDELKSAGKTCDDSDFPGSGRKEIGMRIEVNPNGRIFTAENYCYENYLVDDSFNIQRQD